jgi:HK97 family phage prohead protease
VKFKSTFNPQFTKDFKFTVKAVDDKGSFSGLAAVYGNLDLGGDIIAPGAFSKTIRDKGGKVPILWQHDTHEPIGLGTLDDAQEGLKIDGQLCMESPVGQKAYALMKMGVLKGLSIGYDTIVSEWDSQQEIRTLKELRLWEVSLVTFPMNPLANVTDVKAAAGEIEAAVQQIIKASERFQSEIKAGRKLSAATMERLTSCMDSMKQPAEHCSAGMGHIQALIDSAEPESPDKSAAKSSDAEPGLHSAFDSLMATLGKYSA